MLFADDAAVCATSEIDFQIILQTFYDTFQDFGLQMAIKKTEVLLQRPKTQPNLQDPQILIDTKQLRVVNKFKYVGSHIDNKANISNELSFRIQRANASFAKLYQKVWKKKHLKLKLKAQIYRTVVFPSLTYGCETWNWNSAQMKKLEGHITDFFEQSPEKLGEIIHHTSNFFARPLKICTIIILIANWANDTNRGISITAIETYCRLARLR